MNQFSFSSEDDHLESHCLQQDIGFEMIGDWRGNSEEKASLEEEANEPILTEFDMELDDIPNAQIVHNFSKNTEYSDFMDTLAPEALFKKGFCLSVEATIEQQPLPDTQESSPEPEKLEQSPKQDQQTLPSEIEVRQESSVTEQAAQPAGHESIDQQAVTFYEANTENTTVVRSTMLEEKWQQGGKTALNQFLSVCNSTYSPLIQAYKAVTLSIKAYSERSIGSLDMYCLFFRIKYEQELKRLAQLQQQDEASKQLMSNSLLENVYLSELTVVSQMAQRSHERRQKSESFCEQLDESINKIKLLLGKASESRVKKIESLEEQLERISRIQQELIQLLNHSPKADADGWLGKADIKCDRYLQRKYLLEREALFLSLLTQLKDKVVGLLNAVFLKEDPIMFAVLNRELIRYRSISDQLYGPSKNSPPLAKVSTEQIDSSLKEVLQGIIPVEWVEVVGAAQCSEVIEQVNSFLQNQIFLPVVELEQEHIRIMTEALWVPRAAPQPDSAKPADSEWQPTYNSLVTDRNGAHSANMKVKIVLTVDKYLHLECGQQIASLKLRKLKLGRKGKSVVVSEKSRSIVSLFATALVLGELQFDSEQASSAFIEAIQNIRTD